MGEMSGICMGDIGEIHAWNMISSTPSAAAVPASWRQASTVHATPARSRSVGLVVTPWNMPSGSSASHSATSAVSRKKRLPPRATAGFSGATVEREAASGPEPEPRLGPGPVPV